MRYSWSFLKNGEHADFPETYILRTIRGDRLKVEANRLRGMIRIIVEEYNGSRWQSVISNGVVIREVDALSGRSVDLEDILGKYSIDLSSLPDNQILRLIGGNYGVMTEFLGKAERLFELDPNAGWVTFFSWWRNKWQYILAIPQRCLQSLLPMLVYRPRVADLIDAAIIGSLSWLVFQWNYSYLQAGTFACAGALACGLADVFIRHRAPYLMKVLVLFLPGMVAIWLGWHYQ